jgi:hypothetical protein
VVLVLERVEIHKTQQQKIQTLSKTKTTDTKNNDNSNSRVVNTTDTQFTKEENVHSVTTCKKGQQKQRSRFLQEYKSETSYTLEGGHVGRNM